MSLQEPSSSTQKFYKLASMVRDTPDMEKRVLKRKQLVPQIGSAPDPDDDPNPGDDNDDEDDEPPPPTPSRSIAESFAEVPSLPKAHSSGTLIYFLPVHGFNTWVDEELYQGPMKCVAERSLVGVGFGEKLDLLAQQNEDIKKQFSSLLGFVSHATSAMEEFVCLVQRWPGEEQVEEDKGTDKEKEEEEGEEDEEEDEEERKGRRIHKGKQRVM
ncbi:hypothetical protein J3R30DRAFT_3710240 [Lentinula aciculospora]|uniref:Uncharacterized protein n=1 Tax=Lentinula aciculospora TaxID=153920 RepID=A0A9W8ZSR8_9AGAR|nr:hypothetical protein J3R30DRAFT_3722180 [Lentinula aciculospora]KAJ4471154.1 hypothetical protein J3R30DRAFT_3710240 [Lentinula aciculospora]